MTVKTASKSDIKFDNRLFNTWYLQVLMRGRKLIIRNIFLVDDYALNYHIEHNVTTMVSLSISK